MATELYCIVVIEQNRSLNSQRFCLTKGNLPMTQSKNKKGRLMLKNIRQ